MPLTSYQKRMFAIVTPRRLRIRDVALLVFLVGALKNYSNLAVVEIGYLSSETFVGQLVGNLLIGSISNIYGRHIAFQSAMVMWGVDQGGTLEEVCLPRSGSGWSAFG